MEKFLLKIGLVLLCCLVSFLNYCLFQIGFKFALPITILLIAAIFIYGYRIPATAVILIGFLDDTMLNTPLGVYALLYMLIVYLLSIREKKYQNSTFVMCCISATYIVLNIVFWIIMI